MTDTPPTASLIDLSVNDFLQAVSAASPTPGGGSAAALAGATAAALVAMVAGISRQKSSNPADQALLDDIRTRTTALQAELTHLITRDAEAYAAVLAAYRLPRETDVQIAARTTAIQTALTLAARTPLDTATACAAVLALADQSAGLSLRSAASDLAVAAMLAHTGLRGAALNVTVNLDSIRDQTFVAQTDAALDALLRSAEPALAAALAPVGREG